MSGSRVELTEWKTYEPEQGSPLCGLSLNSGRDVAGDLMTNRQLEVLELAQGLRIQTFSWIGRVQIGDLTVSIQPKIPSAPFFNLLRYAYRLRNLTLFNKVLHAQERGTFQDLIVWQLAAEVKELIKRGLHRDYRRASQQLTVPKGRVDFQRYLSNASGNSASLPCIFHPRTNATILNRVLQAGALLAMRATEDTELQHELRRLSRAFEIDDPPLTLNWHIFNSSWQTIDRRTRTYKPAFKLISLLMQGFGISSNNNDEATRLPGFLFDMNRFFQALLSRYLHDNLLKHTVRDEHSLTGMFTYSPHRNPKRRRPPKPRPDFVVLQNAKVKCILDAKYRDLWETRLPRDMLYQLAIYALSLNNTEKEAIILYPTVASGAVDQTIVLHEPLTGREKIRVVQRPVDLFELNGLIEMPQSTYSERLRASLADRLVHGGS